ncbi:MAG: PepSY domain-containing protein [Gammaproteobacteria bacterium]
MRRLTYLILISMFATPAMAGKKVTLEDCLKAVSAIKAGDYIKVEYLSFTDEGGPAYEIEVRDPGDKTWEFECSARTGHIVEMEQEVDSPDHELFKRKRKISEDRAIAIAKELYPGTVKTVEYEIESNGAASYEISVVDDYGVNIKVEVDASSGDIVEVQYVEWQIGEEKAEMR